MSDSSLSPSFDETGADLSPLDDFSEIPGQGDPNVEPTLVGAPDDNLGMDLEIELDDDFENVDPLNDELADDEPDEDEFDDENLNDADLDDSEVVDNELDDDDPLDR